MNVKPPLGALPARILTIVWLLYSEYIILWRTNEDGVSVLNSTQSMMNRTFGHFSFIELGIIFAICSPLGQIQTDPKRKYM